MKAYKLKFTPEAERDLEEHITAGNKPLLKKIYKLFEELQQHPQTGTGKPEKLRYKKQPIWSRRINGEHRILYIIEERGIFILSLKGHYDDK